MKITALIQSFLKIGVIGFGGGSALIPVIEKELVQNRKVLSSDLYEEHTIIANLTPGAQPVKLAAAAGQEKLGAWAAFVCGMAIVLPGVVATIALMAMLAFLSGEALLWLELAAVGILAFILLILGEYIRGVQKNAQSGGYAMVAWAAMLGTCLLTFGKEARTLILLLMPGWENVLGASPWFDLSAIDVFLLAFFVIFGTSGKASALRTVCVALIGGAYVLLTSALAKAYMPNVVNSGYALPVVGAAMLAFVVVAIVQDIRSTKNSAEARVTPIAVKPLLIQLALFVGVPLGLCLICVAMGLADAGFFGDGTMSVITSFGGGQAYIAVADSVFVDGGFISHEMMYTQIIPITNALPGALLVKMLAGVGYVVGLANGGIWAGLLLALACTCIGVCAGCAVFVVVYAIYRSFAGLTVFMRLKRYILPVVCGLLLTTMFAMIETTMQTCVTIQWPPIAGIAALAMFVVLGRVLGKRLPDAACVLILGVGSLLVLRGIMTVV